MFKTQTVFRGAKMLLIFCFVLLLAGCVKTTQNIVITEDGRMYAEVITDSTELNEAQKAEGNYEEKTEEEICETASIKKNWGLETEECEVSLDKNIVSVKGSKSLTEDSFLEQNGYIRFSIEDLLNEAEDTTFHIEAEDIEMLRSGGVETYMNIEMPDNIVVANRGEISGNTVTVDMISVLANKKEGGVEFVVISKSSSAMGEIPWDIEDLLMTQDKEGDLEQEGQLITKETENAASLPATGSTNVFTSIWTWIKALF